MARIPSVFVSYSWDSGAHKNWVRQLASRLARNGVKVWLDQWHVRPGDSLTTYMERRIASSGHVLVICTPGYARKSNSRTGGVGYEQQIISGRIAAAIPRRKFIPILRSGKIEPGRDCAIPTHFAGIFVLDMRTPSTQRASFEQLIRAIYNKPKFAPPASRGTPMLVQQGSKQALARATTIRLADFELERWRLASGVLRNQQYPKTFWIPSEAHRRNVKRGDFVKLAFEIIEDGDKSQTPEHERMWVKVTRSQGPYFVGKLANEPTTNIKRLKWGSRIVFLPEHIIGIQSSNAVKAWNKVAAKLDAESAKRTAKRRAIVTRDPRKPAGSRRKLGHLPTGVRRQRRH